MSRVGALVLFIVLAGALSTPLLLRPRTDEERVRAVVEVGVAAALSRNFEREWTIFSAGVRAGWEGQLADWKRLDPESAQWSDLRKVHGLEREDVLAMAAGEFFAACYAGRARLDPEWWAEQNRILPRLLNGRFEMQGDTKAEVHIGPEDVTPGDIEQVFALFEREAGEWRFAGMHILEMRFRTVEWHEPELELAWAWVQTSLAECENGLIVNLLADGRVVVDEQDVDFDRVAEAIRTAPDRVRVFRCDRRVSFADAVPWIRLLAEGRAEPLALAVSSDPDGDGRCAPWTDGGQVGIRTAESRLDLSLPNREPDFSTPLVRLQVDDPPMDEADWGSFKARIAKARTSANGPAVLVPAPDATWGAVVPALAALEAAGVGDVLLADSEGRVIHTGR